MTHQTGSIWKAAILVAQLTALTALTAGWTNELNRQKASTPYAQQLSADSGYMMKLLSERGQGKSSMDIDLADARQHQFVMNRLLAAGKTPINSPYLFQRISEMRAKAQSRVVGKSTMTTTSASALVCTHLLHLGKGTPSGGQMLYTESYPVVTCEGGAAYVYTDVSAYNSNASGTENYFLQSNAGEDYSGGTNFDSVQITPQLPASSGRYIKTDSLVIADDALGNEVTSYALVASAVITTPPSIAVVHPAFHNGLTNGGNIQMCQQRGNNTDCDYALGNKTNGVFKPNVAPVNGLAGFGSFVNGIWTADPNAFFPGVIDTTYLSHLYVPMQGTFTSGTLSNSPACVITGFKSATATLIKTDTGGSCQVSTDFSSRLQTGFTTSSWSFLADFTNNLTGKCNLTQVVNEAVKLYVGIEATTTCGQLNVSKKTVGVNQSLFFRNSCLAEGTLVLLADGSSRPIEQIKEGDRVVSDNKGLLLTVTDLTRGIESEPLVVLQDTNGRKVRMTEKHPVVDANGKVHAAVDVQVGDQLVTKSGPTTVTAIERVPYDGQVYNLKLGTTQELAKANKQAGTLFADGFLVGDKAMQDQITTPQRKPADVFAQLPKAWQQDFRKSLARSQSAGR